MKLQKLFIGKWLRVGSGIVLEPHSGWEAPPGTGGGKPREGFLRGGRAIPLLARNSVQSTI